MPTVAIATLLAGAALMPMSAQAVETIKSKYSESGKGGYIYGGNSTECGLEGSYFSFSQALTKNDDGKSTKNSG